ncbi:MAG: hypothetical protein N2260_04205 [Syntrophobacterales bacterium]|nr:hypothetical protein [Syntrophobacterales bacterium]
MAVDLLGRVFVTISFLASIFVHSVEAKGELSIKPATIIVSAEGLSDPNFYKDKTLAYDEALRDAKRQAIEKAVGCYVSSQTIVENYTLVRDQVISKSEGVISKIINVVNGGIQEDGFYHVWIKAEVFTAPIRQVVSSLSKLERMSLIREKGNPTFSVGLFIVSPDSYGDRIPCEVCNREIANRLKNFGYKVISEEEASKELQERVKLLVAQGLTREAATQIAKKPSDISINGLIKLRRSQRVKLSSGIEVQTTLLTAWSIEAVDNHSSEVIFSENFRPQQGVIYNDEDEAIMDVGKRVGDIFSQDIFKDYIMRPTHDIILTFSGIPDRELAKMMKKELLGIRSVLNVTFREFLANGDTVFEVEFAGPRDQLADILDGVVLKALNSKYGERTFVIQEERGDIVKIKVDKPRALSREKLEEGVPTQLVSNVSSERVREIIKSPELSEKYKNVLDL